MGNDAEQLATQLAEKLHAAAAAYSECKRKLADEVIGTIEQLSANISSESLTKSDLELPSPRPQQHPRLMNEWERARLDYFQKHVLPQYIEQLKFRGLGLQIFLASEAVLFNASAQKNHFAIPIVGLAACLSLWLWDRRIRDLMEQFHQWGQDMADQYFFERDKEGRLKGGIHAVLGKQPEGKTGGTRRERWRRWWISQTRGIEILLVTIFIMWLLILIGHVVRWSGSNWSKFWPF